MVVVVVVVAPGSWRQCCARSPVMPIVLIVLMQMPMRTPTPVQAAGLSWCLQSVATGAVGLWVRSGAWCVAAAVAAAVDCAEVGGGDGWDSGDLLIALSVSISNKLSPEVTSSPSAKFHLTIVPSVIVGDNAGSRIGNVSE